MFRVQRSVQRLVLATLCGVFVLVASPAKADSLGSALPEFLPIGETAKAPSDWAGYCARYQGECDATYEPAQMLVLNQDTFELLSRVNMWANSVIKPETDRDHWGVADRWDDPQDGIGDCEDIAIFKQRALIALGIPRDTLLLTVVWDRNNQGHAVLTAHTSTGDYVLDSKTNDVLPWSQTGYDFVKRQSQANPNEWVFVDGLTWPKDVTLAKSEQGVAVGVLASLP